jgi:NaMN:DMB phosphoribosyltransferase
MTRVVAVTVLLAGFTSKAAVAVAVHVIVVAALMLKPSVQL